MSVSTGKAKLWLCRRCSKERQPLLTGLNYDLQISLVEGQHAQIVGDLSQPRRFRTFNAGQNMSVLSVVPFRTTLIPIANTKKLYSLRAREHGGSVFGARRSSAGSREDSCCSGLEGTNLCHWDQTISWLHQLLFQVYRRVFLHCSVLGRANWQEFQMAFSGSVLGP